MGLSSSATMAILLVGIVTAVLIAYPLFLSGMGDVSDSYALQQELYDSKSDTLFYLPGISVQGSCNSYNLTIALSNNGSSGIDVGKLILVDNNVVLAPGNTSTTVKFYSKPEADGFITYDGGYSANTNANHSVIGVNRTLGVYREYRSYLSFNTSSLPDDVSVGNSFIYTYFYNYHRNVTVTHNVTYGNGFNAIGGTLDVADWGMFTPNFNSSNYGTTYGWKILGVPESKLDKQGDSDFELRPSWNTTLWNYAIVRIYTTETGSSTYDPYLLVTYMNPEPLSRVLAPSKSINMIYYNINSSGAPSHTVAMIAENGIAAYGSYTCS